MKKLFELEWNDDLGEGWMNISNLELCLFSKEHTKRELVRIKELPMRKPRMSVEGWEKFSKEYDGEMPDDYYRGAKCVFEWLKIIDIEVEDTE